MAITSSRLANGTPSLMTKWRTRVARTQLEFTARDHEFTSSPGQWNAISLLVNSWSRVEWNTALEHIKDHFRDESFQAIHCTGTRLAIKFWKLTELCRFDDPRINFTIHSCEWRLCMCVWPVSWLKPPTGRRQVPVTNCSRRVRCSLSSCRKNCKKHQPISEQTNRTSNVSKATTNDKQVTTNNWT